MSSRLNELKVKFESSPSQKRSSQVAEPTGNESPESQDSLGFSLLLNNGTLYLGVYEGLESIGTVGLSVANSVGVNVTFPNGTDSFVPAGSWSLQSFNYTISFQEVTQSVVPVDAPTGASSLSLPSSISSVLLIAVLLWACLMV
jgi:hypothetical protein